MASTHDVSKVQAVYIWWGWVGAKLLGLKTTSSGSSLSTRGRGAKSEP